MTAGPPPEQTPAAVVGALRGAGLTVGTAESLTGGLVCAALTEVPSASAVVRGGVVPYALDLKHSLLGVDAAVLDRVGAVAPGVATAMAQGVRAVLGCDLGVARTGVAGPDTSDGRPVGTDFVAVAGPSGTVVREHAFSGDREAVRRSTLRSVVALLAGCVRDVRVLEGTEGYGGPTRRASRTREEAP